MWSRKQLKTNAKSVLSRGYWIPFLACIILGVVSGNPRGFHVNVDIHNASLNFESGSAALHQLGEGYHHIMNSAMGVFILSAAFVAVVIGFVLSILFRWFVLNPLKVGRAKLFLDGIHDTSKMGALLYAFQKDYLNIVKIMLLKDIKIFLWSLLFIIPGIVKSYEYRMVEYLLAKNSSLSSSQVFYQSNHLTNGQKGKIFILDLSFIGWMILCGFTLGIGNLFLMPYIQAVDAQLFDELTQYA